MPLLPPPAPPNYSPPAPCPARQVISVNRVKGLVREDAGSISTEACFAIAKATELLVERVAERAAAKMAAAGRDSLEYRDVAAAVAESPALDWLGDIVPQTVKAAALLPAMS